MGCETREGYSVNKLLGSIRYMRCLGLKLLGLITDMITYMREAPVVSLHVLSRESGRMCAAAAAVTRH